MTAIEPLPIFLQILLEPGGPSTHGSTCLIRPHSISMRQFVGIDLGRERVPDETTILNFRHLLERHDLTQALFDRMNAYLASRGLQKGGAIVDATIIAAPSSTSWSIVSLLIFLLASAVQRRGCVVPALLRPPPSILPIAPSVADSRLFNRTRMSGADA